MPLLCTAGAASARGFGEFYQRTAISTTGWMARIGTYTNGVASDSDNNFYVIKPNTALVFKVSSDGTLVWQNNILQSGNAIGIQKIAVSSPSLISVSGQTGAGSASNKPSVVFLNSDGTISSSKYIDSPFSSFFSGAAFSSGGSLYLSGLIANGRTDFFRIYNGSVITKKFYSNSTDSLYFIGSGAGDTAYLGDSAYGVVATVVKVDSNISILWKIKTTGTVVRQVVESNGFVYAVGSSEIFKINASTGAVVWARGFLSSFLSCIALDSADNIYVAGNDISTKKGIVYKVSNNNSLIWQRAVTIRGLPSYDYTTISSVAINNLNSSVFLQITPGYSSTNYSVLLSVPADGTLTGTYTAGGTTIDYTNLANSTYVTNFIFSSPSISFGSSLLTNANLSLTASTSAVSYDKASIP